MEQAGAPTAEMQSLALDENAVLGLEKAQRYVEQHRFLFPTSPNIEALMERRGGAVSSPEPEDESLEEHQEEGMEDREVEAAGGEVEVAGGEVEAAGGEVEVAGGEVAVAMCKRQALTPKDAQKHRGHVMFLVAHVGHEEVQHWIINGERRYAVTSFETFKGLVNWHYSEDIEGEDNTKQGKSKTEFSNAERAKLIFSEISNNMELMSRDIGDLLVPEKQSYKIKVLQERDEGAATQINKHLLFTCGFLVNKSYNCDGITYSPYNRQPTSTSNLKYFCITKPGNGAAEQRVCKLCMKTVLCRNTEAVPKKMADHFERIFPRHDFDKVKIANMNTVNEIKWIE